MINLLTVRIVGSRNLYKNSIGFPNKAVVEAYLNPEVNKSRERFSWGEPDLESLRDYLQEKIGWNREKFNRVVAPVLERFKNKEVNRVKLLKPKFKISVETFLVPNED